MFAETELVSDGVSHMMGAAPLLFGIRPLL